MITQSSADYEATARTLHALFHELFAQRALLDGMLLKANMVLPGKDCPQQVSLEEVAEQTVRCLRDVVPVAVPGIVFISGGQSGRHATAHLNAMNNLDPHPWELSFSFARALQQPALDAWKGEESNFGAGQDAFHHRASSSAWQGEAHQPGAGGQVHGRHGTLLNPDAVKQAARGEPTDESGDARHRRRFRGREDDLDERHSQRVRCRARHRSVRR